MKTTPLLLCLCVATAFPSSAATILFDLQGKGGSGLLSTNANGTISGSPGSGGEIGGGISYDDVTNALTINVGWGSGNGFTDLSSSVTAAHVHGPADINSNAGVQFSLSGGGFSLNTSASAGSATGTTTLTAGQETDLLAGNYYINIHTSTNSGGEIRGNLVVVPEPGRIALASLFVFGLCLRRRR